MPDQNNSIQTPPANPAFPSLTQNDMPLVPNPTPPVVPPPTITTPKKKFGGGRIIATILGILLLVGGVGAGVFVTQQSQDVRERASEPISPRYAPTQCQQVGAACQTSVNCPGVCGSDFTCNDIADTCTGTESPSTTGNPNLNNGEGQACTADGRGTWTRGPNGELYCGFGGQLTCSGATGGGDPCTNAQGQAVSCTEVGLIRCNCGGDAWVAGKAGQTCFSLCGPIKDSLNCHNCNPQPDPTPPPGTARCQNIKAYSTTWTQYSSVNLSELDAGTQVNFCVTGSASAGTFDRARFTINGTLQAETTTKRPSSQDYCQSYSIPANVTQFTIKAQIHHITLGWK